MNRGGFAEFEPMSTTTRIRIGAWVASPALNLLESAERSTKLEPRTMDVLAYLAARPGEVVSVEELLASVWRGVVVSEGSVYQAIKQLRQILSGAGDGASYIETIPKRGYRLTAPVEKLAPTRAPAAPSAATAPTAETAATSERAATSRTRPAAHLQPATRWLATGAALAIAAVAALAASAWRWGAAPRSAHDDPPLATRFVISVPGLAGNRTLSVSPDGRYLAYTAGPADQTLLYIRSRGAFDARPLPGTEGATMPFWSPDSREVGFRSGSELKRVAIVGGEPRTIADIGAAPLGTVTWSAAGGILFDGGTGIQRVPADGGTPARATTLAPGEGAHTLPSFLPDGRRFFFMSGFKEPRGVYVQSLDSDTRSLVSPAAALAAYASGYLLLNQLDGTLTAQPFDLERLEARGEPVRLANDAAGFSVSSNGVLAYVVGRVVPFTPPAQRTQLAWYDRGGRRLGPVGEPGVYRGIALSPDGHRAAVHRHDGNDSGDIWVLDVDGGGAPPARRTFNRAHNVEPVWSPDGSRILYTGASFNLYLTAAAGGASESLLLDSLRFAFASDWSADGSTALVTYVPPTANEVDIAAVVLDSRIVSPVAATPFNEGGAKFSPDGRAVVYNSNESGRIEVYARLYRSDAAPTRISTAGGAAPRWSRDGREVFYLMEDGTLMAASVAVDAHGIAAEAPRALFKANLALGDHGSPIGELFHMPYDVAPDGERFLVNERIDAAPADTPPSTAGNIAVIVDWAAELTNAR